MLASQEEVPPFDGRLTAALGAPDAEHPHRLKHESARERRRRWKSLIVAVEREADSLPPGRSALCLGVLRLATGRVDDAVAQLQAAAAYQPANSDVQNALAVAHLTRALRQKRPFDLVLALAAVDRALIAAPDSGPLLYNRALILSSLHLPHEALEAWKAYRKVASDPTTLATAHAFEARFMALDRRALWRQRMTSLQQSHQRVEPAEIESLVADFPYQARIWAEEELFGQWAEAMLRKDFESAGPALDRLRLVSAAVERQHGDRMLVDAVAVVEAAPRESPVLAKLIEGHRRFARGMAAYDRQDLAKAEPDLAASEKLLSMAGSSFAGWASFYRAVCTYYRDAARAVSIFQRLDSEYPASRYPVLNGRVHWLLATALGVEGRDQQGLEHNERALRLLEAASGEQEAAFVHTLLAEAYDPLGEVELGWQHRLRSLEVISGSGDHRRIHSALNEAAQALLREGFAGQALTTLDELLANAEAWPEHPIARAEGLTQRAQTQLALGQVGPALADIRAARTVLITVPDSDLKKSLGIWLDLYEGLAWLSSDPRRAVDLLTVAFEHQSSAGYEWDRPRYLAERARAYFAMGDPLRARADLLAAVNLFERTRSSLHEAALKMHYFRLAQPAFEALMTSDLQRPGGEEEAFVTVERARARFFLDRRLATPDGGRQAPSFPHPRDLARVLPKDVALVEYAVLPSQVVAWVVEGKSWRFVRLSTRSMELEARVEQLRRELERGGPETAVQSLSSPLFNDLIRPLDIGKEIRSLIFVPDRFLLGLPFAVLYDSGARRYLIERFAVSSYPSSALLLSSGPRRQPPGTGSPVPVLVVGASISGPDLPSLRRAEVEARAVGALYPQSEILLGADATRDRVLKGLARARIVHIASHAVANAEVPLRSRIFLAPGGFDRALDASELWALDLRGIDLLVLASCESMAGQADEREALFGISGGLLAAGVRTVVGSLWRVDDRASGDLMAAFHRYYREDLNAPQALRHAVLDVLTAPADHRASPASWGAFAVLGGKPHYRSN